jgi:hypothetical protein
MTPRREEIETAVAAYDRANPLAPLPRNTVRLLAAMFPKGDVCRRSLDDIATLGFGRKQLPSALNRLVRAGFLTWEVGTDTFRLHLPPVRR